MCRRRRRRCGVVVVVVLSWHCGLGGAGGGGGARKHPQHAFFETVPLDGESIRKSGFNLPENKALELSVATAGASKTDSQTHRPLHFVTSLYIK